MKQNVEAYKSKIKKSHQTLSTTTEIKSTSPNLVGKMFRPKDKITRLEFTKMISQENIGTVQSQHIKQL